MSQNLAMRIAAIREEALGIRSYVLESEDGSALPPFTAGAHIDVLLDNGMVRSYSLTSDPEDRKSYEIAVLRDASSRGGSAFVFDNLRVGSRLSVSRPRNHFPLDEAAPFSVLFAGGIGITPMLPMVWHLEALGREWKLYYSARSRAGAAFLNALLPLSSKVHFHCDEECGGFLDIREIVRQLPAGTHVYACGPKPMLAAFQDACSDLDPRAVHLEHFSAAEKVTESTSFEVHLARTARTLKVEENVSILDRLLEEGLDIPYSCREGTCGECEVKVLDGVPDHRDVVLSKKKRAENKVMMICCSRARTESLTLDL